MECVFQESRDVNGKPMFRAFMQLEVDSRQGVVALHCPWCICLPTKRLAKHGAAHVALSYRLQFHVESFGDVADAVMERHRQQNDQVYHIIDGRTVVRVLGSTAPYGFVTGAFMTGFGITGAGASAVADPVWAAAGVPGADTIVTTEWTTCFASAAETATTCLHTLSEGRAGWMLAVFSLVLMATIAMIIVARRRSPRCTVGRYGRCAPQPLNQVRSYRYYLRPSTTSDLMSVAYNQSGSMYRIWSHAPSFFDNVSRQRVLLLHPVLHKAVRPPRVAWIPGTC
jgi:hypothetical protein